MSTNFKIITHCSSNASAIRVHVVDLKQEITVFGEIK